MTEKRKPTALEQELNRLINDGYIAPEARSARVWPVVEAIINENLAPAIARARDAALEEARIVASNAENERTVPRYGVAEAIGALKSSPAERYLPESEVRRVLGWLYNTVLVSDSGDVLEAARRLGVDLDAAPAKTEPICYVCRHAAHGNAGSGCGAAWMDGEIAMVCGCTAPERVVRDADGHRQDADGCLADCLGCAVDV